MSPSSTLCASFGNGGRELILNSPKSSVLLDSESARPRPELTPEAERRTAPPRWRKRPARPCGVASHPCGTSLVSLMPERPAVGEHHRDARAGRASAITSASRIEPPGWTMARTPASAACVTLSANGKKPSLASTVPASVVARAAGLHAAPRPPRPRARSARCPGPPAASPRAITMALERAAAHTSHANAERRGLAVGRRALRHRAPRRRLARRLALQQRPRARRAAPATGRRIARSAAVSCTSRRFFLPRERLVSLGRRVRETRRTRRTGARARAPSRRPAGG